MTNLAQIPARIEAPRFDALIAYLREAAKSNEHNLVVQHLKAARAYLEGGMPSECAFNLELARDASGELPDHRIGEECTEFVDQVLARLSATTSPRRKRGPSLAPIPDHAPDEPSTTAIQLTAYFHGGGVRFGSFYPVKHLVAVVESYDLADRGRSRLTSVGFPPAQVMAVSGEEFNKFLEDLKISRSLTGAFMTEVSRILDTEAGLIDQYSGWAKLGAGFVIAYSPTEASAGKVSGILMDVSPVAAHWFATNSIHRLI
jgi:hypothetical protein